MVEPWFAVVIVFREFLVSGLRSFLESRGVAFGASRSGKLKMLVQSITIPVVLFYQANLASVEPGASLRWLAVSMYWITVTFLGLTLLLTVASSFGYVHRAIRLIRSTGGD
jgi:phosphatidylglycerophosphate synthase